jgi:hypothetical protein
MIALAHFDSLTSDPEVMPVPDSLGFPHVNHYDLLIAGWTKYWNEVLKTQDPLTPDFVKALIATESSFNLVKDQSSNDGPAMGLIQITESTRKIHHNIKVEVSKFTMNQDPKLKMLDEIGKLTTPGYLRGPYLIPIQDAKSM